MKWFIALFILTVIAIPAAVQDVEPDCPPSYHRSNTDGTTELVFVVCDLTVTVDKVSFEFHNKVTQENTSMFTYLFGQPTSFTVLSGIEDLFGVVETSTQRTATVYNAPEDDQLNCRTQPGGKFVTSFVEGNQVTLTDAEPVDLNGYTWWQIELASGIMCWSATGQGEESWLIED